MLTGAVVLFPSFFFHSWSFFFIVGSSLLLVWGVCWSRFVRGGWRVFCFAFSRFARVWRWIHLKVTPVVPDVTEGEFGVGGDSDCLVADIEVASSWVGPNIGP